MGDVDVDVDVVPGDAEEVQEDVDVVQGEEVGEGVSRTRNVAWRDEVEKELAVVSTTKNVVLGDAVEMVFFDG